MPEMTVMITYCKFSSHTTVDTRNDSSTNSSTSWIATFKKKIKVHYKASLFYRFHFQAKTSTLSQ